MRFPMISELVNKDVIAIPMSATLSYAIEAMYLQNHRSIIIQDKKRYFIITASDLLRLKLKDYNFEQTLDTVRLLELPIITKDKNILETISFLEQSVEYICVVNEDETLYGLLTHTDIISNIDPETLMDNYRLCDLININKSIHTTNKETNTLEVLHTMVDGNFDNIIVVDKKMPVGIMTTKDIMKVLKSSEDLMLPIKNYMTAPLETLNENATLKDAITFMKNKHFKRIVVVNGENEIVAIILQRELITLSYNKWAMLMKEYSYELSQINTLLEQKNQKYEAMATTDQLTSLYNRYKFTELFVSEYGTMTKRENKMSLVMLDIDYFKKINDTYGHNVGDQVLSNVGAILSSYARNVDIVARWGGEEFVILLPTASFENSIKIANKIRTIIEESKICEFQKVTASFGITEIKMGDTLEEAIKRADDALYEAKQSGRNTVKVKL